MLYFHTYHCNHYISLPFFQEYDFVFSVDIAEGEPPLKLPYNMTEDPWVAAQNFITKHGLNQAFLEQVRDFILQNTQSVSISQQSADSTYRDPLTGKLLTYPDILQNASGASRDGIFLLFDC